MGSLAWSTMNDTQLYSQILQDDTRRDMAILFINRNEQSMEEIAFRLGFSEASTFIRAFKKWTVLTPLAYRKHS